jgi:hypothetical protein
MATIDARVERTQGMHLVREGHHQQRVGRDDREQVGDVPSAAKPAAPPRQMFAST